MGSDKPHGTQTSQDIGNATLTKPSPVLISAVCALGPMIPTSAVTNHFFNPAQTATLATINMASATISSRGLLVYLAAMMVTSSACG